MAGIYDVVAADYPSLEDARADYERLCAEARSGTARVEGLVLVEHDEAGHLRVVAAAGSGGRTAGGRHPGVDLLLTLFEGPGGKHPLPVRPAGSGAVVALVDHLGQTDVPPALAGCSAELVLTLDERDVAALRRRAGRETLAP